MDSCVQLLKSILMEESERVECSIEGYTDFFHALPGCFLSIAHDNHNKEDGK